MRFKPGQSGNPGGRPKDQFGVRELARKHGTSAIKTLVSIMDDKKAPAAARTAAANALLDRGYGKPEQHQTTEAITRNIVRVPPVAKSAEEWLEIARAGGYGQLDGLTRPADDTVPPGGKAN